MPEKVLEGMKAHTLLGRLGQPEDIANADLFLASDEAGFISANILRVDGGIVIGTCKRITNKSQVTIAAVLCEYLTSPKFL